MNFESKVDWTDELTVKYYILLADQCLTGEVTHIDIPRGRDLYSVMYVSPRTIARILNGRPMTSLDIQDVGVQLVSKGQVLVTKSYKAPGRTAMVAEPPAGYRQGLEQERNSIRAALSGIDTSRSRRPPPPNKPDQPDRLKPSPL